VRGWEGCYKPRKGKPDSQTDPDVRKTVGKMRSSELDRPAFDEEWKARERAVVQEDRFKDKFSLIADKIT